MIVISASAWPATPIADLTEAHFESILGTNPELVLLGTGVMYGRGVEFEDSAGGFAGQVIDMYVDTLGGWSGPVIVMLVGVPSRV